MQKLSPEQTLRDWANGTFVGKYDRSAKDVIKVVATGFLFLGGIVREALGKSPEQFSTSGIDLAQAGDGDKSQVPEDSEDGSEDDQKRGPGRPRKS